MYYFEEEFEKQREVIVLCAKNGCYGVITHNSCLTDCSPRVHGECSKCGSFMSVKLANIEDERIIRNGII